MRRYGFYKNIKKGANSKIIRGTCPREIGDSKQTRFSNRIPAKRG